MDKEIKAKWVEALRSGKYLQGKRHLKDDSGRMCCLGVLCDVQGADFDSSLFADGMKTSWLPRKYSAGLTQAQTCDLASTNDNGADFARIASLIEERY